MPCYAPMQGYRSKHRNSSGKRSIVFDPVSGFHDMPVKLPCGQCIGCRLEKSRQWAVRIMHEASLYTDNCFITLTYDDEHIPDFQSLRKRDFQLFLKRLRKRFEPRTIRYFHCGEYGDSTRRPHYHAILFNFDFPDKVKIGTTGSGLPDHASATLAELWRFGRHSIGSVSFESAAYVARYVTKKVTGKLAESHYSCVDPETGECGRREAEYATMSLRPGIGKGWYEKFHKEVYPLDRVVVRGVPCKPPRYYDNLLERDNPDVLRKVTKARDQARSEKEETPERLAVREKVRTAQVNLTRSGSI
jgi:hypothetical protein